MAHYTLMLAYRGLGELERSREHQAYYERFKADEASQILTGAYRQQNPHDNNERQPIHEHVSVAPEELAATPEAVTASAGTPASGAGRRQRLRGGTGWPRLADPTAGPWPAGSDA